MRARKYISIVGGQRRGRKHLAQIYASLKDLGHRCYAIREYNNRSIDRGRAGGRRSVRPFVSGGGGGGGAGGVVDAATSGKARTKPREQSHANKATQNQETLISKPLTHPEEQGCRRRRWSVDNQPFSRLNWNTEISRKEF